MMMTTTTKTKVTMKVRMKRNNGVEKLKIACNHLRKGVANHNKLVAQDIVPVHD